MTNVYRIKLFRWDSLENRDEYRRFCLEEGILAVGWPAPTGINYENKEQYAEKVNNMFYSSKELKDKTPEEQEKYIEDKKKEGKLYSNKKSWSTARNIFFEMKEDQNNFIWTQEAGDSYYLGKITDNEIRWYGGKYRSELEEKLKEYRNNGGDEKGVIDLKKFGLWRSCNWRKRNFDDVPGNVVASLSAQGTMSRISTEDQKAFYTYCHYLYDETIPADKLSFWDLVHYDDLEDLVGLYLQTHDYYIFPSTNKQGTKNYEFKLVRADGSNTAIIQCKNNADIPWKTLDEYKKEDIYVFSVKESYGPKEENPRTPDSNNICPRTWDMGWQSSDKEGRIKMFDAKKLEEWVRTNAAIMPMRIQKYLEMSKKRK